MKTHANDQDPQIQKMLDPLLPVPPRDQLSAIQGRGRFLAQAATLRNTQPISKRRLGLAMLFSPSFLFRKEKLAMVATFIVVLALLFGGTGMTAYAAQGSLPGEALYPVKTFIEDTRLSLTSDPTERYTLLDQYVSTRFNELDELHTTGAPLNMAYVNRMLREIDQLLQAAATQSDEELVKCLEGLSIRIQDRDSWETVEEEGNYYGESEFSRLRSELNLRHQVIETGISGAESLDDFRLELQNRANQPEVIPPDAPLGTPGGVGPGDPGAVSVDPQGVSTRTPYSYYYFPGQGGMGTGQKGKP